MEVHQTGEEYVIRRLEDDWQIASKRKRKVKIDGNEYRLVRERVPKNIFKMMYYFISIYPILNIYYFIRYDLRWKLIDP
ncbi:hypothetical protein C440_05602 [Haloferax mucosum ATCC BAA-1512]|uniref:Uncharacterized protein n=1 Tax=Haloferax mucosum ATCC BAA-1512 TaxID=662479 RepID=M0IGZ9_9EURY|nr:hypothetical protein C440_05602 [Haloferax mucosum ATCC BAA-1512]